VGRGPLAGPVVACACAVSPQAEADILDVNDSKSLSPEKRERLFSVLSSHPGVQYAVGWVSAQEIDRINILQATFRAMREAAEIFACSDGALCLVDGNQLVPQLPVARQRTVVKGDAQSMRIAAASVIAKVTRDRYMCELDAKYPGYGFARNKGYGTQEHIEAVNSLGPCPEHRLTFLPDPKLL